MVTLMCQTVDSDFYPIDRMFAITISPACLISEIKSLIISQIQFRDPTVQLMLWKLSDASLIGDDGSELDADDLLCIFHCNQAKAKALILPSFPLLQQDFIKGTVTQLAEKYNMPLIPISPYNPSIRVVSILLPHA